MKKREFIYSLGVAITTIMVVIATFFQNLFGENKPLQIGLAIFCFLLWAYGMFVYPPKNEKPTKWYHYFGLKD